MAWFIIARLLFVGAVSYSAYLLRPVGFDPTLNVLFGFGLAVVAVGFEYGDVGSGSEGWAGVAGGSGDV